MCGFDSRPRHQFIRIECFGVLKNTVLVPILSPLFEKHSLKNKRGRVPVIGWPCLWSVTDFVKVLWLVAVVLCYPAKRY